ncbi:tRNA (adenosine(37)-N6)-threonylcarbamoyltransferase complex dimerization subunit type 1 TsaB [Buchnera aphidicola]|nr:tRNA (adenosine(37)-N6)-threonylcarbamoyltransferase complex dimerization subunit type 1 TsaB [Buchnera aphidicola]
MKILSIDGAFNVCSIALLNNGIQNQISQICNKNHLHILLPLIHQLLNKNNIKIQELNLIAFSRGPGNFTSIRIVTNIIQGLSLAYNIPIIGISTLKVIAEHYWKIKKNKKIIVCINANSSSVYLGKYIRSEQNVWKKCFSDRLMNKKDIQTFIELHLHNYLYIGNNYDLKNNKKNLLISQDNIYDQSYAIDMLSIASYYFSKKKFFTSEEIFPNYIINLF